MTDHDYDVAVISGGAAGMSTAAHIVPGVSTADIDETIAQQLVSDLVDDGVVTAVAEQRVLVHEPSDEAFDSIRQVAVFHRGWSAARDAGAGGE